jgi:hypothetical protein
MWHKSVLMRDGAKGKTALPAQEISALADLLFSIFESPLMLVPAI